MAVMLVVLAGMYVPLVALLRPHSPARPPARPLTRPPAHPPSLPLTRPPSRPLTRPPTRSPARPPVLSPLRPRSYFVISATELVYEQAEAIAAMEAGLLPPSGAAIVLSNTAAIVAFLACSLRLSLPPTTRWPLWLATVATLGPAAYWAIQYRSILPVLGHYFLLPFVPLPMLAITVYSVWSASATARQIDDLSTLMYKSKSS